MNEVCLFCTEHRQPLSRAFSAFVFHDVLETLQDLRPLLAPSTHTGRTKIYSIPRIHRRCRTDTKLPFILHCLLFRLLFLLLLLLLSLFLLFLLQLSPTPLTLRLLFRIFFCSCTYPSRSPTPSAPAFPSHFLLFSIFYGPSLFPPTSILHLNSSSPPRESWSTCLILSGFSVSLFLPPAEPTLNNHSVQFASLLPPLPPPSPLNSVRR